MIVIDQSFPFKFKTFPLSSCNDALILEIFTGPKYVLVLNISVLPASIIISPESSDCFFIGMIAKTSVVVGPDVLYLYVVLLLSNI